MKEPRTTSKSLLASFAAMKIKVRDSTIRNPCCPKITEPSQICQTKKLKILMISQIFGKIFCGLSRQNSNFFGRCESRYFCREANIISEKEHQTDCQTQWC
ncbi:hypothetical protein ILYODFUR_026345 [Ilyodon furcidens]|uniref:Uncharacterized protein n=1 Tax=Ilyodon furcidens TaxID=33524 RepID=A0ABV0TZ18_9TELE